jgi:hypothetical protein
VLSATSESASSIRLGPYTHFFQFKNIGARIPGPIFRTTAPNSFSASLSYKNVRSSQAPRKRQITVEFVGHSGTMGPQNKSLVPARNLTTILLSPSPQHTYCAVTLQSPPVTNLSLLVTL